jgi:hypothetical protein
MGRLDDCVDRKDVGILTIIAAIGVLIAVLSLQGCIAILTDKVEMKDPHPDPYPNRPYSAAAPIPAPDNPGRYDPEECTKDR